MTTVVTDKTLADFETKTSVWDKEVPIYDAEGEIKHFWRGQVFEGGYAVITTRQPGKHPKLVEITHHSTNYGQTAEENAENDLDRTAKEREKRVPVLRKDKAEAKLLKLIQDSGTNLNKFAAWSYASGCVMFFTPEQIQEEFGDYEVMKGDDQKKLSCIMERLRKEGDSYFGGLKLARLFIEQIKPGGLADQLIAGVRDMVEQNLVPWPYVAGYLRRPVMESNDPRELAVRLIDKHADVRNDGMGHYKEGTTVEGLLKMIYSRFIKDIKPDVLDALTLD